MTEEPEQRITEFARMNPDCTIEVGYLIVQPGISPGHSLWTSGRSDKDYEDVKERHGIKKPGQSSTIYKELRNGVWKEWQEKEGDWT